MFDTTKIYNNLMTLCNKHETFFYSDQELDDKIYRLFNHRITSYSDFLLPDALECRGIMYDVTTEPTLVSLPMRKFFNYQEVPLTMNIDFSNPIRIMDKVDGSLISTYVHNNKLRLKTKGSLQSEQAIAAMEWLNEPEQSELYIFLCDIACIRAYTCNLEWIGPSNRIVLGYPEHKLVLLNIRSHKTGDFLDIYHSYIFKKYGVKLIQDDNPAQFIENIPHITDKMEGFVVEYEPNKFVKIKTDAYKTLHKSKNNVNTTRRLFEIVLDEVSDDLKTLFVDDEMTLKLIEDMEAFVELRYNHLVDSVERFYERNKHMQRKEYAILGQKELKNVPNAFQFVMSKYVGRTTDYKEVMKRKWKSYGLSEKN